MNDLEHDLRELLDDRARSLPVSSAAPEAILRRGRRRQVGVVAAGGVMVVAVIAIAAVGVVMAGDRQRTIPVAPPALPERTATINGITVTAPAGWTLLDDWPLASVLPASSQTCSFSATGIPVAPSADATNPATGPSAGASPSCESQAASLPAGLPVLQLTNFGSALDGAVCHVDPLRTVDVPPDGAAAYVAAFPNGVRSEDLLNACPGAELRATFSDESEHIAYAAVSIVGPEASSADIATVDRFMTSLEGLRVPGEQPATQSPGYVVAAGADGGTTWRLEAGFPLGGSGSGIGATLITTDAAGQEVATPPVGPITSGDPTVRRQSLTDGSAWLDWGTAPRSASTIASVAPDGTRTEATLVPWPDGMRATTPAEEQSQLDGSIWFAIVPELGRIEATGAGSQTGDPTPTETGGPKQLQSRETDAGDLVIYGNDLGHDWELRHENGRIVLYMDGATTPAGSVDMLDGRWTVIDASGGSFVIGTFAGSVQRLWVTPQGSDASIEGGYVDAQDRTGAPGRVWLIALPGSGWGTLENGVATRGWWISWPSVMDLHQGAVLRAGGDGTDVSWSLVYQDDHCVRLRLDTSSIAGEGGCLDPWPDLQRHGGLPLIGGVYGQRLAVVVFVLPADARVVSFRTDSSDGIDPVCATPVDVDSNFATTQFCVFPLTVGSSATTSFDANGDPLGGPIGVTAKAGTIEFTQGTASPAAPASP